MDDTQQPPGPAVVTLVHAHACHFCEEAQEALAEIEQEYPLRVEPVAAESDRGKALIGTHRAGMFPLVLVDGVYFSAGRLPRGKLRRHLQARASASASRRDGAVA